MDNIITLSGLSWTNRLLRFSRLSDDSREEIKLILFSLMFFISWHPDSNLPDGVDYGRLCQKYTRGRTRKINTDMY